MFRATSLVAKGTTGSATIRRKPFSSMVPNVDFRWSSLTPERDPVHGVPCERSSHGVSILPQGGSCAMVLYGGERVARTPLEDDQALWVLDGDLATGTSSLKWRSINTAGKSAPPARVAHAQAAYGNSVFIFGGRAGITMEEKAMNDLWKLDCSGAPGSESWSKLEPDTKNGDEPPEARSFHKMIQLGGSLYVFGGCSANHGRLADLHRYDIEKNTWQTLGASPHLRGRGGANLMTLGGGAYLGVVAGFCGEESNDGHRFDLKAGSWETESLDAVLKDLRPRSVCVSGSFPSVGVAVIFGGEVDPSQKGHEGAGGFENDIVWLDEKTGTYLGTQPDTNDSAAWPKVRGWSDGATVDRADGSGFVIAFGGLTGDDKQPERLSDLWRLDISKK